MAFTDVTDGSRTIIEGRAPVKITLKASTGAVKVGDPIGYSSGWLQADGNGTYAAVLFAGQTGIAGQTITAYRAARIGGITTGTAGNKLYLSNTAGAFSATAGSFTQVIGVELGGNEIWAEAENEAEGYADNTALYFGDASDVSMKWDGSNFEVLPVADDTGVFAVGDGTTDMDFKVFLGNTTNYLLADVGNARVAINGVLTPGDSDSCALGTSSLMFSDLFLANESVINFNNGDVTITHAANLLTIAGGGLTMGASGTPAGDFILWGTQALAKIWLDVDGDTNGAFYFGADDTGIDVSFYGQTASNSMVWDASSNALVFTAGGITMGVASKLVLPVKASGSTTQGDFWFDTSDSYLHFYSNLDGERRLNHIAA